MNPEIDPETLSAFVDGELDALSQRQIEQRLVHDNALRTEVAALRQMSQTVRSLADYHMAPADFRQRVASMVQPPAALPARLALAPGGWQAWFDWRPLLLSLGTLALLVLMLNLTVWRPRPDDRLAQEVVASHVRSTLGQHLVDVASSDHHTVKPWLSARLDFSPPVQLALSPGSVLLGGRVDYLGGRPVAALVYRHGQHVVNAFVWPSAAADSAALFSVDRGFQIAHWTRSGLAHWVISDLGRDEFKAVVQALDVARGDS